VTGVMLQSSEMITVDAVVLATNLHAALRIVGDEWSQRDPRFRLLDQLQTVPILGAHLWFDRPVIRESHAAMISPGAPGLQWLFRKDADGRAVHGVISASREYVGQEKDELLPGFESQIRSTLP